MGLTNEELLKKIDDAPLLMAKEAAKKKLRKPRSVYSDQAVFMLAIVVMATVTYGLRALAVCAVSVMGCIITDMIGCFATKKEYSFKDLSNICYGLAVALMLPASVEYPIVLLGAVLSITVKHVFGGKDNYIFNPAAVAIAFLIICYPSKVLFYPETGSALGIFDSIDTSALSGSIESYFIKMGAMPSMSALDILMGSFTGPMGTTHILVIIVCGICLICRRSVSFAATVGGLGVMAFLSYVFAPVQPAFDTMIFMMISGFALFGFVFLASDPQTLPLTNGGRVLYGLFLGTITTVFRHTANIEGVFVFSLLIVNALSLYLDEMYFNMITGLKRGIKTLHKNLGSYERITKEVKQGKSLSLEDTQEIMIEPVNYNMPPIDNKVVKVKRRKKVSASDIFGSITDKFKTHPSENDRDGTVKADDDDTVRVDDDDTIRVYDKSGFDDDAVRVDDDGTIRIDDGDRGGDDNG